ncbi:hypothetical protein [Paraburkholderia rhynchosiae]|uniref:Uncharacterized protein n=1 Tax=Paraburkholderia rhynchosiae TaxID=487049 RepID=A0A2N7WME1_9BURK|nr:hypothetical protein [Paraburkholderia rhynchosiae]PMS30524.1 hypothetical protein C0Z16_13210 [Paraburkholderia rhynchosiae]CAB3682875.1 hypothetical protein LMG27174_02748 [Paraburkholderia rhynchosiae]
MRAARGDLRRERRRVLAVCAASCMTFLTCVTCFTGEVHAAAPAPGSGDISKAEQLIFTTDHLHGIAQQTELDYALLSSDPPAHGTDIVKVLVVSPDNAKGDAQVSDHSGAVPLPNGGLQCNPVIIYFLERDIAEMERLTGGQRRYFQQRLRLALAANPKIETVTSQIDGKPVKAQQIVVQPYLGDPNAERFAQYIGKRYTFLIADTVPGEVALIRTDVPGANNDFVHPLHSRTLSFQAVLRKLPLPPNGPNTPNTPNTPNAPHAPNGPVKPSNAPRASR